MAAIDRRAESMQKRFLRAVEFLTNMREKTKSEPGDPGHDRVVNV